MARQLREPTQKLQFASPIAADYGDQLLTEVRRLRMVCDRLVTTLDDLAAAIAESSAEPQDGELQRAARRARQMLVGLRGDSVAR